jgi:hypothetical protein
MSQAAKIRAFALAALLCAGAGGCSDIYFARRDTISLGAGDAGATNVATQTIDLGAPEAGETRIVSNGVKIQGAVERYRTNKVTPPVGTGTSSVGYAPAQSSAAAAPSVSQ